MSLTIALKAIIGMPASNETLMARFSTTGDKKALSQLYDNCAKDLYHYISSHSDRTLAKDVCQKAWLKVIEKHQLYEPTGKFKTWLFTLARNQLFDEFNAANRLDNTVEHTQPRYDDNHDDIGARFDQALAVLPFEQREAFVLQQEGFSLTEIASITHCKQETIKSRLRYAKVALKKLLEPHYE